MKKFSEAVKVKLNSNIESYFRDVEVESIKHNNTSNTISFYLISYNIINRDIIKAAENDVANQLFNINVKDLSDQNNSFINPVRFSFKYKLDDKYTCKEIYDEIKKDLFHELKDLKVIYTAFFRNDNVKFIDDNTMEISFLQSDIFKDVESELLSIINDIFHNRYNRDLKIITKFVDNIDIKSTMSFNRMIKNSVESNADVD